MQRIYSCRAQSWDILQEQGVVDAGQAVSRQLVRPEGYGGLVVS